MLIELNKKRKGKQDRVVKNIIPDSCAIKCYDFNYQAMIDVVAGFHTSPIIFNNTCWSWSGISDSFILGGARGYVGTIRAISNEVAMNAAEAFYSNFYGGNVLNSIHHAISVSMKTASEDIYIYWGLHFSTIKRGVTLKTGKQNIVRCLLKSFYLWSDKINEVSSQSIRDNIEKLINWNSEQIRKYFIWDYFQMKLPKNRRRQG